MSAKNCWRIRPTCPFSTRSDERGGEPGHSAHAGPQGVDTARQVRGGVEGNIQCESDPYQAAQGAHAVVLITHWEEYRTLDYRRLHQSMEKPASFFDGRNLLEPAGLHEIGFNVYPIGKAPLIHK